MIKPLKSLFISYFYSILILPYSKLMGNNLKVNNYLLLNTNNEFHSEVILQNEIMKP
jgi:hypothetical protein